MPDSKATIVNGEKNNAESSTKNNELCVNDVSEMTEDLSATTSADAPDSAQNKRKLPTWMVGLIQNNANDNNSRSKRLRTDECLESNNELSGENPKADTGEEPHSNGIYAEAEEATNATGLCIIKTELTEADDAQSTTNANVSNFETNYADNSNVNDATTDEDENADNIATNNTNAAVVKNEPTDADNSAANDANAAAVVKDEPTDDDTAASTSTGVQNPNTKDIKPAVKIEKADASSTSRESCKYGIRCYRRNPMHRIEEAHPGDHDYKRPDFPLPPLGTPACPYGNSCYRRNPQHFQLYSHPADSAGPMNRHEFLKAILFAQIAMGRE